MNALDQRHVVGRKNHECALCGETIVKGERHRVFVGSFDGEIQRTRYHEECDRVTEIDGWQWHDWEDLSDQTEFRIRRDEIRVAAEHMNPNSEP